MPNGKVTLPEISRKLHSLIKISQDQYNLTDKRLRDLETMAARHDAEIKDAADEVKAVRAKSEKWDIGNTFGTVIAAILALSKR